VQLQIGCHGRLAAHISVTASRNTVMTLKDSRRLGPKYEKRMIENQAAIRAANWLTAFSIQHRQYD
jgi:hypothetical protein